MKTPRFTDSHRFPNGYVKSAATDVKATFRRIERERKEKAAQEAANKLEAQQKTAVLPRIKAKVA